MKKRFVLSVITVMAIGISCSGCGISGAGAVENVVDVGILNEEEIDVLAEEIWSTESTTVESVSEIEESVEHESLEETTASTVVGNKAKS